MNETPQATISNRRKLPAIWIIPLIAFVLGIWMVLNFYLTRGPQITITFSTAEGIEADKTKIKALNIDVGVVEGVKLNPDLESVLVTARIDRDAASLLRKDSSFWVVRPRIGTSGVTGLSTLLSGAYIELSPGVEKDGKRKFMGLDEAPITPMTTPGLHITLLSDEAGSVSIANPVLYHGYRVGRVESTNFDTESKQLQIGIFVEEPYDSLVTSNSRFWNSSGIEISATATGISVNTGSLESVLLGGISFDVPENLFHGLPVENHTKFKLYKNAASISENPYEHFIEYLLLFDTSVRGLIEGAPVLYRGLRVGTVVGASFNYLHIDMARMQGRVAGIPVLIRLEPGRWLGEDTAEAKAKAISDIKKSVDAGLRATIKTGNLITGAQVVSFDFYEDVEPQTIGKAGNYTTIPTIPSSLEDIQIKIANLLEKLNKLPLQTVLVDADKTLQQVSTTFETVNQSAKDLNEILQSTETHAIPESLNATLQELQKTLRGISPDSGLYQDLNKSIVQLEATLRNVEQLTYTIDTKPNSLIFSKPKTEDLQPQAQN